MQTSEKSSQPMRPLVGLPQISFNYKKPLVMEDLATHEDELKFIRSIMTPAAKVQQHVYALFLNANSKLLAWRLISVGNGLKVVFDGQLLLHIGLRVRCSYIVIAQSQPHGIIWPNYEAAAILQNFATCCHILGMRIGSYWLLDEECEENVIGDINKRIAKDLNHWMSEQMPTL